MLSALAEAIKISPKPTYLEAANRNLEFVFTKLFRDGHLLHTYKDGHAKLLGYLDDYAFLAVGLLDFYEAIFEASALEQAAQLADTMVGEFWDEKDGAFFYTGRSHEQLISRTKPAFDGSIPSGNAMATQCLLRLYHFTGRNEYLHRAEKVLRSYYNAMQSQPFGFAHMLCALDYYLEKPKEIVIVGRREDPSAAELITQIHSFYLPNKTLRLVGPQESLKRVSPLLEGKTQINGRPTVYVCHNYTCSVPVTTWDELKNLLET
jgi:uncharacterized protein YyaL (SSP411 family)